MEYIVALNKYRHFVLAAEACGITQPTLSAMIQKLEDELDVKIFNRDRKSISPTIIGEKIIKQAEVTINESLRLKEIVADESDSMSGTIRIGILPTIAPYILPDLRIVDRNGGFTIIPELHLNFLSEKQKNNIAYLNMESPAQRVVSLIIKEDFIRERVVNAVVDTFKSVIPSYMIDERIKKKWIKLR